MLKKPSASSRPSRMRSRFPEKGESPFLNSHFRKFFEFFVFKKHILPRNAVRIEFCAYRYHGAWCCRGRTVRPYMCSCTQPRARSPGPGTGLSGGRKFTAVLRAVPGYGRTVPVPMTVPAYGRTRVAAVARYVAPLASSKHSGFKKSVRGARGYPALIYIFIVF